MYINKTEAELVFELLASKSEELSLGQNRLNFIASRQEMLELMEKIVPVITNDGWTEDPEWTVGVHRRCIDEDLAERKANLLSKI